MKLRVLILLFISTFPLLAAPENDFEKRVKAIVGREGTDFVPDKENQVKQEGRIEVIVVGSVAHPGKYYLPAGSLVIDALEAAGGIRFPNIWNYNSMSRISKEGEKKTVKFGKDRVSDCKIALMEGDTIYISDADF